MSRLRAAVAAVILSCVVLAACGGAAGSASGNPGAASGDPGASAGAALSPSPSTADDFPVTVDAANGSVEIPERPDTIVSLSPTATEMLFAIGAGNQVEAVDSHSNHPSEAPTTDLSGFEPNVEAVAGYQPDLVTISNDPGDLESSLTALDIPVLLLPAAETFDDSYDQIAQLGAATGHADEAADVVERMRDDIDKLAAEVGRPDPPLTYYHELDDTFYSATSDTFIGQVYDTFGLDNIADQAPADAGVYPQLSSEFIVDADPDLIFLADTKCCGQSPETVAERPGWDQITAVRNGAVIPLDDDVASRWGPRIVDLMRTVADAVAAHADIGGAAPDDAAS